MSDDEIAAVAGCDLLNEAPEIRNWLLDVEKGKELIVGGTAHLSINSTCTERQPFTRHGSGHLHHSPPPKPSASLL